MDSSYKAEWRDVKGFLNNNVKLNMLSGSKFIRTDYEADKLKVVDYYNTQGFRDAEVISDTLVNYDRTSVDVFINVNEGHKYYFRNITWTGNFLYSATTLNKVLDIKKGGNQTLRLETSSGELLYSHDLVMRILGWSSDGSLLVTAVDPDTKTPRLLRISSGGHAGWSGSSSY